MKLGVEVGLGPGHIVLDGKPAPPLQRGTAANFRSISVVAKGLYGARCHLVGREVGLGQSDTVLDGDPAPLPPKGARPPNFQPLSVVAKRLDGSRCHLVWRYASAQATLC